MVGEISNDLLTICSIRVLCIVDVIKTQCGLVIIKYTFQLAVKAEAECKIKTCGKMIGAISFSQQK